MGPGVGLGVRVALDTEGLGHALAGPLTIL